MLRISLLAVTGLVAGQLSAAPWGVQTEQKTQTENQTPHHISTVREAAADFARQFPGPYSLNEEKTETIDGFVLPQLIGNNIVLNNNPFIQQFATRHGGQVVVFIKLKDEFVAVASSLRGKDGKSPRGLTIDHDNAAYQNLLNGMSFAGNVKLFDRNYTAKYDLIKNKKGDVIGAFLVAIPANS